MKRTTTLLAALLAFFSVNAQNDFPCATDFLHQQALQNSVFFKKHQAIEQEALDFFTRRAQSAAERGSQVVTVPVVVHIIHDNGPENIPDAQVQQAISWLNQSFANAGYYAQGSGAEVGIQFCLAQRTPSGQPTNGITRDQSALTNLYIEGNDGAMKNINRWAPKDYINIWVVRDICSATYGCGVVAYAYHPAYHGSNLDGIVVEAGYFGTTPGYGSILAHEVGHYFGLYHTFEGGCANGNCLSNGDRVCDTPPDQSTAAVPCDQPANTCSTDTQSGFATDQPDMNQNFLDYGNLNCQHDFTPGQADRMNFYLNGTRKSLLESKGCLPPCPLPVLAAFSPGDTTILAGQTLLFNNNSQNAVNFSWTINSVPFGGQQNAAYLFDSAGVFTIQLVAQPLNGQLCEADSAQVVVQVTCPVVADFAVSNLYPEEGQTIFISNNSQNASQFEWFVNGVSQGAVLDSVVFGAAGNYDIRLVAVGSFCSSSVAQSVQVRDSCTSKTFFLRLQPTNGVGIWEIQSSAVLADGHLIAGGIGYWGTPSKIRVFFVKMEPNGGISWSKLVGRDFAHDAFCHSIVATPDGGFAALMTQYFDTLSFPNLRPRIEDLVKFSPDGTLEWIRRLPESGAFIIGGEPLVYESLILTTDGGLLIDAQIKFDLNGNLLWGKIYESPPDLYEYETAPYPDGGCVRLWNGISNDFANYNTVTRFDADGNPLWSKTLELLFQRIDIKVSPQGDIFILGVLPSNILSFNHTLLLKLSPEGEIVWSRRYLKKPTARFEPRAFALSEDGITIAAWAWFNATPVVAKNYRALIHTDYDGNIIWVRHFEDKFFGSLANLGTFPTAHISAIPGGGVLGVCRNSDTGEIGCFKTDPLGYAGECESTPVDMYFEDEPTIASPSTLNVQTGLTDFPLDTLPIIDYPITLDTICAPACPRGIELCNNNLDDDDDGLFDCLDPDCDCAEDVCNPGEANIWYFGDKAGLDFSTEPPTVLTDGQGHNYSFAAATASDVRGKLLFYTTDGDTVYNRFHEPMPNGIDVTIGGGSTGYGDTESMIVPHPGDSGKFYLFTSGATDSSPPRYSLVDMRLDGGRGDIMQGEKSIILAPNAECRFAAIKSCSFKGFWLLAHRFQSNEFLAYKIDSSGLDVNAVVSATGSADNYFAGSGTGQMKFSPNGKCIARGVFAEKKVEIYDFDSFTGNVNLTFSLSLPSSQAPTGIEFSPTGRFLYVTTYTTVANPALKLFQIDLEAGDKNAVENSTIEIASLLQPPFFYYGEMQLAPNGKIYVAQFSAGIPSGSLGVIHKPDERGVACQFQPSGQSLASGTSWGSLCNFVASYFAKPAVAIHPAAPDTICILDSLYTYTIEKSGCFQTDSTKWTMEGLSGTLFPEHSISWIKFDAPGEGRLIYTAYNECGIFSDTLHIVVVEPFDKTLALGPDRVVCDNGVFTLNAGSGFARYRWQNGAPDSVLTTLLPGKYWVDVWDACGNQQSDTITVSIAPATELALGDDRTGCPDLTATFHRPGFFSHWKWSPADFLSCDTCVSVTVAPAATTSWIVVAQTDDGCISVDTVVFQIRDTLFFELDTSVCFGQMLDLFGISLPADTTAQFFFPTSGSGCDTLLTVNVLGLDAPFLGIEKTICANEFFIFRNVLLPADTTAVFLLPGAGSECDSVITVTVKSWPPLTVVLPPDTTLRLGATLILNAETSGMGTLNFQWSPAESLSCTNCPAPETSPLETTLYTLMVADANGCRAQDSVLVTVDPACVVIIPNAFTPNGDGVNDFFYPKTDPCVHRVRVWRVVSRWGEVVFERQNFEPGNSNLGWDGTRKNGEAFPSDVLVWYAELEYYDGRVEARKGDVALLR